MAREKERTKVNEQINHNTAVILLVILLVSLFASVGALAIFMLLV